MRRRGSRGGYRGGGTAIAPHPILAPHLDRTHEEMRSGESCVALIGASKGPGIKFKCHKT